MKPALPAGRGGAARSAAQMAAAACLLLLLGAPLWLGWYEPGLFIYLNHSAAALPPPLWAGLSLLGNGWGLLALTSPLLVLAPRLMWAWLFAAPFAALLSRGIKVWLDSPRPAAVLSRDRFDLMGEVLYNQAFPSGHTLSAFAAASAIYLAARPLAGRWVHWLPGLFVLASGVGLSRVAVGAHWPADVWAGAALGLLAGALGHLLQQRVGPGWYRPQGAPQIGLAVVLLLTLWQLASDTLDFEQNRPLQLLLMLPTAASLLAFAAQLWRERQALRDLH